MKLPGTAAGSIAVVSTAFLSFCTMGSAFTAPAAGAVRRGQYTAIDDLDVSRHGQTDLPQHSHHRHIHQRRHPSVCPKSLTSLCMGPAEAWEAYNSALELNPLIVKSVTAAVILGAADLAGQALENRDKEEGSIDYARFARFAFFGLVLQAPWNHFYYLLLDGTLPPTEDPLTATTGIKIVIDQFVQAPIFTVLIFAFLGILEGKSTEAIQDQLKNDYKDTMLANWKLWVPATVVNIAFVPPLFRVLYLNCVFFFWSIFLSIKINSGSAEEEVSG